VCIIKNANGHQWERSRRELQIYHVLQDWWSWRTQLFIEWRGYICDQTVGHASSVNTTGFRVLFLLFFFISRQLFACLLYEYVHHYCKECMGRQLCLLVFYEKKELRLMMDGGGNNYIEERFA
jgi:hypothetical protein